MNYPTIIEALRACLVPTHYLGEIHADSDRSGYFVVFELSKDSESGELSSPMLGRILGWIEWQEDCLEVSYREYVTGNAVSVQLADPGSISRLIEALADTILRSEALAKSPHEKIRSKVSFCDLDGVLGVPRRPGLSGAKTPLPGS